MVRPALDDVYDLLDLAWRKLNQGLVGLPVPGDEVTLNASADFGRMVASDCYVAGTALTTSSHLHYLSSMAGVRHSSPRRHPCRRAQKPNLRNSGPQARVRLPGVSFRTSSGETQMTP